MKLLVCTDGSEHSLKAVRKAAELGKKFDDLEISLLHSYDIGRLSAEADGKTLDSIKRVKKQRGDEVLEEAEKLLNSYGIKQVNKLLKEGNPVAEITDEIARDDYEMVLIGNRGFGRIRSMLLGSISNAVAQEAKTNVLIVKE